MFKQSVRNQRSQGMKVKHVVQISLLLGVCFWLLYQVQQAHGDKVRDVANKIKRLGRRDIPPGTEEVKAKKATKDSVEERGRFDGGNRPEKEQEQDKTGEDRAATEALNEENQERESSRGRKDGRGEVTDKDEDEMSKHIDESKPEASSVESGKGRIEEMGEIENKEGSAEEDSKENKNEENNVENVSKENESEENRTEEAENKDNKSDEPAQEDGSNENKNEEEKKAVETDAPGKKPTEAIENSHWDESSLEEAEGSKGRPQTNKEQKQNDGLVEESDSLKVDNQGQKDEVEGRKEENGMQESISSNTIRSPEMVEETEKVRLANANQEEKPSSQKQNKSENNTNSLKVGDDHVASGHSLDSLSGKTGAHKHHHHHHHRRHKVNDTVNDTTQSQNNTEIVLKDPAGDNNIVKQNAEVKEPQGMYNNSENLTSNSAEQQKAPDKNNDSFASALTNQVNSSTPIHPKEKEGTQEAVNETTDQGTTVE
ncbi:uncharacterized protein LOC127248431 isoform X2 [Andrographis paniculata]|uniref:uncharacterized protein LOC127248431 isoform X2 n=1 Tax=Andrographis paniculata TaxID=175694 RepID=UPI0021E6ECF2|nr:uncharacterized protein LOC127248431 isoform X2 [Andrographis paniculata]